jgi:hypothetical protein
VEFGLPEFLVSAEGAQKKGGEETRPLFKLQMSGKYGMLDTSNKELQKRGNKMSDVRTIDIIELDGEVLYDTLDTAIEDIKHNWKNYVDDYRATELIEVTLENSEILVRYETDESFDEDDEEPVRREVTIPYKYQYLNVTYKY